MELQSISSGGHLPAPGWSVDHAQARSTTARTPQAEAATPAPGTPQAPGRVDVSVEIREDGVQQVTVIDVVSGQPLYQVPSPQVLHVLDHLITRLREERAHDQ